MAKGRRDEREATLDLRSLDLAPGEARDLDIPITVEDLVIGGERYRSDPPEPMGHLEVSQSASGRHFRLRLATTLTGPCWRCLADARIALDADVRDFAAFGRPPGTDFDEDLDCEYLDGDELDVGSMGRDALIDLLPSTILCRAGCAGLCPTCGTNRNDGGCDCPPPPPDARWEALREIAGRLGTGDAQAG